MKTTKNKNGFTLFEIFIALTLVTVFFSSIFALIQSSSHLQKEAEDLTIATHLARQIMETVKTESDETEQEYELEGFENFSANYSIKNEEYDLAKLAENSKEKVETVTGAIFELKHYQVVITYANNKKYVLDFYRGEGVKQN